MPSRTRHPRRWSSVVHLLAVLSICSATLTVSTATAQPPDPGAETSRADPSGIYHRWLVPSTRSGRWSQMRHGSSRGSGSITPIEAATNLVLDPATRTVYVAGETTSKISVVDGRTCNARRRHCRSALASFPIAAEPGQLIVDSSTHTLYLPEHKDGTLAAYDLRHCRASSADGCGPAFAHVPVGDHPVGLSLDSQTHTLYVGNEQGHIDLVNAATCNAAARSGCTTPATRVPMPLSPIETIVDPATSTLYVPVDDENGPGRLLVLDTRHCRATDTSGCGHPVATVSTGAFPLFPVLDTTTQTLYMVNVGDGTISVVATEACQARNSSACATAIRSFPFLNANVLELDSRTHSLYVLQDGSDRLAILDTRHCRAHDISGCESPYPTLHTGYQPWEIRLDARTSTMYVTNRASGDVRALDAARCNVVRRSACRKEPRNTAGGDGGVAIDPAHHTYYQSHSQRHTLGFIDTRTCNIEIRTSCGDTISTVPLGDRPASMAIDLATHTLYVTDWGREVLYVIDTSHCNATRQDGCRPFATIPVPSLRLPAVNSVTHRVYVTQVTADPQLAIINGARCNAKNRAGCHDPVRQISTSDFAGVPTVDPATNTTYVTTNAGDMDVVNGPGCDAGTSGCRVVGTAKGVGNGSPATDSARHTVYVGVNVFDAPGGVTVVNTRHCRASDVTGCNASWPRIPAGRGTLGVTFDPYGRRVFTSNVFDASMNVINVRHCSASDHSQCQRKSRRIAIGPFPVVAWADPVRNTIYANSVGDAKEWIINLRHPCRHHLCFR
jgi:DNA-binding beta-propeller fold protein YncE